MLCPWCQKHPWAFEQARAPFAYAGTVREAIHAHKYQARWQIGQWLATRMAEVAISDLPVTEIDMVLPVPMHWLKQRIKGFHPVADLARTVAQILQRPHQPRMLRRTRWSHSQTRLTPTERLRNVRGAFRLQRPVHSHVVLLIDDVLTTGATAHACALALREAGVAKIFVLAAAATPRT